LRAEEVLKMPDDEQRVVRPDEIFGTWRLIAYTAEDDQGGAFHYPLGSDAHGFLMYTTDGYMSVHMMRRAREAYEHPDISGGTAAQFAGAAQGYLAYCGPFDIDAATGTVRHLVEVSLLPNWIQTVQLRCPLLDSDSLTMNANYAVGSATVTSVLRWVRADLRNPWREAID
jgi:Lipocalin-like domain